MCASGKKERIDRLVVQLGLAESRNKAAALVMAGLVTVDGTVVCKPGTPVSPLSAVRLKRQKPQFVSRGGEKLKAAIDRFRIPIKGRICIDVGASTGGFTECLLASGASLVYAVDVGYGQLAYSLRTRPEVVVLERTNIRYLDKARIPNSPTLATIDVSFISLRLVLPKVCELLSDAGEVLALVKPQFEVGRGKVGKGGIVRQTSLHREVLTSVATYAASLGIMPLGMMASVILGAKGNQEYFIYARKQQDQTTDTLHQMIDEAIAQGCATGGEQ